MSFGGNHFDRVLNAVKDVYKLYNLSRYVEKYIKLDGRPYIFGDKYGFQAVIIDDTSRVTNTVKPAQIGMTTATMAYCLAGAATQPRYHGIYSLPSSSDAQKLVTTKMNPLIMGSPELLRLLNQDVNNNELKEINHNFLFIRGTKSETAALSISADYLIADEVDRSDPDTLKQFRSRLQASEFQIIKQFSTPTLPAVGISKEAETSVRYRHFATCFHCGFSWLPRYDNDIRIPDYKGELADITQGNIKDIRWQLAHWCCPHCGKDPQLHPSRLQWVAENPEDNYEANTYFITPVTACLVLKPAYLVRTSTEFNTRTEWKNQVLGEADEEKNEQITLEDVEACKAHAALESSDIHCMGVDMGLTCAITIGREASDGTVIVVHREAVPIALFEARRRELIRQFKILPSVHDVYPYTSEIMRICEVDHNAYGAMFVTSSSKNPELYVLREKEEDVKEGTLNLRLLKVNRTGLMDIIRDLFKERRVVMKKTEESDKFDGQYTSLKRVQRFVKDELQFIWEKTDGEDHMMFSLGYLYLALKMRSRVQGTASLLTTALVSRMQIIDRRDQKDLTYQL